MYDTETHKHHNKTNKQTNKNETEIVFLVVFKATNIALLAPETIIPY